MTCHELHNSPHAFKRKSALVLVTALMLSACGSGGSSNVAAASNSGASASTQAAALAESSASATTPVPTGTISDTAGTPPTTSTFPKGQWSQVYDWPQVAINLHLLP